MLVGAGDVTALVRGAEVLGSGGGGDAHAGGLIFRRTVGDGAVELLDPDDADPDLLVAPVGLMGAISVFTEQLPGGDEFARALAAVERWTGRRAQALATIEAAGLNAVTALWTAAASGLPVVDVDLCGRALPRLDQFSFAASGAPTTPLALALPSGQVVVVEGGDAGTAERAVRSVLASGGGWAATALAPVPASVLRAHGPQRTTRRCLDLGARLAALPDSPSTARVVEAARGRSLAAGRVVDVTRHEGPGFGRGSVTVRDRATSALLRLEMENEHLVAFEDGAPVATTPDVLAVLDRRTARAISCERARRGDDVVVVQLPAPAFWRDPARLARDAPRAFGLDVDPVLMDPAPEAAPPERGAA